MYKNKYIPFFLIFIMFSAFNVNAQERVIHGMVTVFDSISVSSAKIKVKSSKQIIQSDSIGNFSVGCATNDVLIVSAKGFYNQRVKIAENIKFAAINLKLKPGQKLSGHAIGYGYISDAENINAVSSIDENDLEFSRYNNIYEIIKGRFSGVQIVNGEIIVRGVSSVVSSYEALIILDGVTVESSVLRSIPTSSIKSINIIKDGSAAIYGARGANGVVIIETKVGNI